jgi:hypothetical protein
VTGVKYGWRAIYLERVDGWEEMLNHYLSGKSCANKLPIDDIIIELLN